MQNLRQTFEKELRLKLSQKATAHIPEDSLLIKALKYYDLNNTGYINQNQFSRAIFKLGINFLSEEELIALFNIYDMDKDGRIDYREFTSILFGNASGITRQMIPSKSSVFKGLSDPILLQAYDNLRIKLNKKGVLGIIELARQFKQSQSTNRMTVNLEQFMNILTNARLDLSRRDVEIIFKNIDNDKDGYVNYEQFMNDLLGPLSSFRKSIIDQAYQKFMHDPKNTIDILELRAQFYASQHPDVKYGRRKETDVISEFSDSIENFLAFKGNKTGQISYQEFEEYYSFMGYFYQEDEYFGEMLQGVWRLNQPYSSKLNQPNYSKNLNNYGRNQDESSSLSSYSQSRPQTQSQLSRFSPIKDENTFKRHVEMLLQRFKSRLMIRGLRGFIGIHRLFRNADTDHDNILNSKEFLKVIRDYRLDITEQDMQILFTAFDSENTGRICYEEFMHSVMNSPSQSRKEIIKIAFANLDHNNEGQISLKALKDCFNNCRAHPDVKSLKKTEDQIRDEYFESIDFIHSLYGDRSDPTVIFEEFERFMSYVSSSIDDDKYFELILTNVFKIQAENYYIKKSAGIAGGRKDYDPKAAYLQDLHRSYYKGESVAKAAPFGTFDEKVLKRDQDAKSISQSSTSPSRGVKSSYKSPAMMNPIYANTYANIGFDNANYRPNTEKVNIEDLVKQIKNKIKGRGIRGMLGLQRMLKVMDLDNTNTLTKDEFSKVLKDFKIELKESELSSLVETFGLKTNNRGINYNDFLIKIRGVMNDIRTEYVDQIFAKFNKDNDGYANIDDIKNSYTGRSHPGVKSNKMSENDAILEFNDTFELHHMLYLGDFRGKNKRVDLDEFRDYYDYISIDFEDDNRFEDMIKGCWKFDQYDYNKYQAVDNRSEYNSNNPYVTRTPIQGSNLKQYYY